MCHRLRQLADGTSAFSDQSIKATLSLGRQLLSTRTFVEECLHSLVIKLSSSGPVKDGDAILFVCVHLPSTQNGEQECLHSLMSPSCKR